MLPLKPVATVFGMIAVGVTEHTNSGISSQDNLLIIVRIKLILAAIDDASAR